MNWYTKSLKHLVILILAVLAMSSASAQATRTWVSGVGDDANPCSRTAPCKTFAGAFSKTATAGEINVLDPGGFGAVTITKAITIDGGGGLVAGVLVGSLTNGVIVNNPSGDVILRNLTISGSGNGLNGVRFIGGGTLRLQNVMIDRFTGHCVDIRPSVANTVIFLLDVVGSNCAGSGVNVVGSSTTTVNVDHSRLVLNGTGISASVSGTLVRLANSTVLNNGVGLSATSSANITSFNNNILVINGADAPTTTVYPR